MRRSVCCALFPTLRPTLDRTLCRLHFVELLSRCVELIGWRNRRKMEGTPFGNPDSPLFGRDLTMRKVGAAADLPVYLSFASHDHITKDTEFG